MATLPAAPRSLLLILLLAGLHSASAALIRPLFQVSDEVTYLASLERAALSQPHDAALALCLSPPDGTPPPWMPEGGKWLFHATGSRLLHAACAAGAGPMAPLWLRLAFSLSLPVIAWAAWSSVRLITGGTWAPAVAALAIATQPVLAKYMGAVTPDSLANACAAIAILLALRTLVLGPSWPRVVGLLVWTGLAANFKDAALFLVPIHGLVLAAAVLRPSPHRRHPLAAAGLALAGVVAVLGIGVLARTAYDIGPGLRLALDAPLTFATRVVQDALSQFPSQLVTAWTSLGGFGGTSAPLPTTAGVVATILWGLATAGLTHMALTRREPTSAVTWYLCTAIAACALQAPVRQVLLETADVHQGRWLFPVAVPLVLGFALGLEHVLGRKATQAWPLVAMGAMLVMALSWLSVAQWHVADANWSLDRTHLFLHSTGGLDIDPGRVASTILDAWPAAQAVAMGCALLAVLCVALLLGLRPVPESLIHVRHADHR